MQIEHSLALILALTGLSWSRPQDISIDPTNSAASAALESNVASDDNSNSTAISEFESEASTFNPDSYTIKRPGKSIMSPPIFLQSDPHQLIRETSNLTSRDTTESIIHYDANDGTQDGNPIVPVKIDISNAHTFLVQARQFAINAYDQGAEPNATSPTRYFKYSSGNLAFILAVSNETSYTNYTWGDYANLIDWLANLTVPEGYFGASTQSMIVNGKVDGGQYTIFGGLVCSYSDFLHSNSTDQQSLDIPATGTGGGGKRLAKRARTFTFVFGESGEFRLRITAAATKVAYGLLAGLVNNAYDQLFTDTGGALIYDHQSIFTFCGVSDCAAVPGNIFDMTSFQGLRPDIAEGALSILLRFADARNWAMRAGSGPALTGEIVRAEDSNVIAKFGIGIKLARKFYCAVVNPDGTQVIGCLAKDEL